MGKAVSFARELHHLGHAQIVRKNQMDAKTYRNEIPSVISLDTIPKNKKDTLPPKSKQVLFLQSKAAAMERKGTTTFHDINAKSTQEPSNTLVHLIKQQKWEEVMERCETHPQDCQFRCGGKAKSNQRGHGYTPLHHCIDNVATNNPTPSKVIETVAKTWPAAVDCMASRSICVQPATPVFLASYVGNCSLETFELLVTRCTVPSVDFLYNVFGSVHKQASEMIDIERHIIPYLSRPLLHQDYVHRASILHHVIENNNDNDNACSSRMVQLLLEAESDHLIRMVDGYGRTALHIAAAAVSLSSVQCLRQCSMISHLLQAHPPAANMVDRYLGYVPLQYFVSSDTCINKNKNKEGMNGSILQCLERLLQYTDPSVRDIRELTRTISLVHIARWNGACDEVMALLLQQQQVECVLVLEDCDDAGSITSCSPTCSSSLSSQSIFSFSSSSSIGGSVATAFSVLKDERELGMRLGH